jgi:Fe-S-cluster containining protein
MFKITQLFVVYEDRICLLILIQNVKYYETIFAYNSEARIFLLTYDLMRYCVFLALKTWLLFTCQIFAGKPIQSNIYEFYNPLLSHIHALISYLHVHVHVYCFF